MSYITSIGTASPSNKFSQQRIADFMVRAMNLNEDDARKTHALYRATGIETRYSVLSDYGRQNDYEFFPNNQSLEPFPSTRDRIASYRKHAVELSVASINQCLAKIPSFRKSEITHLIVVSCTGMYAPGLDIDLVRRFNLTSSVQRTCVNFMGCYAAFNAMKLADSFCKSDDKAKVLIICTELCSLHFQKENTEDNLLANALFADGSAAMVVEPAPRKGINLKLHQFHCDLFLDGEQDMAWNIGNLGFEMKLSTYVPEIIRGGIKNLTDSLLKCVQMDFSQISYFAIHPGGKKILEVIEQQLNLDKESNRQAYHVLKNYGNMSSPTILFVLNEIWNELRKTDDGKNILSFAFGPGLTLESGLFKIEVK